jgi:hypothetical protein
MQSCAKSSFEWRRGRSFFVRIFFILTKLDPKRACRVVTRLTVVQAFRGPSHVTLYESTNRSKRKSGLRLAAAVQRKLVSVQGEDICLRAESKALTRAEKSVTVYPMRSLKGSTRPISRKVISTSPLSLRECADVRTKFLGFPPDH